MKAFILSIVLFFSCFSYGAITFSLRGDNLTPRFVSTPTNAVPLVMASDTTPAVVASADTGLIGSSVIDVDKETGNYRSVRYIGYGNIPDFTTGFSINARVVPRYTGNPAAAQSFWIFSGVGNQPYMMLYHNTNGTIQVLATDGAFASTMINVVSVSTWSPTSGTVADITLTWDGTTTANAVKIYVDASLLVQGTASLASNFDDDKGTVHSELKIASGWGQGIDGEFDYEELTIWNNVITPSSVTLTSGSGSLNGSSRTAFVEVEASDAIPSSGSKAHGNIGLGH